MSYTHTIDTNDPNENEILENLNGVAIIGMAGRFPKASDIYEFWQNLVEGKECITFYTSEELIEAGIGPAVLENPDYVKAKGEVENVDMFDASFFSINPREAEVTDPQHRMLLECAWEALEHAGYESGKYDGSIGIYAGKSMDYYLLLNVYPYIRKEISAGSLQAAIGNDKDSLTTTISYHLDLRGPAITIQTSSSTSLVAVCVACQSILTYQCDIALAGGITAGPPIKSGYLYQEGNIWSPDGHCRAFDAKAQGFVSGCGMGLVVLKRLEDALRDGDTIWAVIKGFAVNNDGSKKVSYSAPSVWAQAEVISLAQVMADVHPETIQYIEAHGTGTNLGDPIEMTALTRAFRTQTDKKQFCAIGSVKTNIGHLDNAAGVAGLMKTILSIHYRKIPASLHFEKPNPKIDFDNSPFYVNTELKEWPENINGLPRRAGVTSLGMGGTNAHVIVEEAPAIGTPGISREWQLLLLSAKTSPALDAKTRDLGNYIKKEEKKNMNLADMAYTLALGRKDFNRRRYVLCRQLNDAAASLENLTPGRAVDAVCEVVDRPVVFMFSGQGAQYVNMGRELYEKEPVFKENIDKCTAILTPLLNMDVRKLLYPERAEEIEKNMESLEQTWLTQPVLVMLEYSLAQLWVDWGIKPAAMIGHSIGEFTAACLSGCMSLEDVLTLVVRRGRLMHGQEKGAMLSVGITESEIPGILAEFSGQLSLAAVNSPQHCVISGNIAAVETLAKQLTEKNIFCKQLHTSHAFHSPMMESITNEFAAEVGKIKLNTPTIPFISCVTGTWITNEEAQNPQYWARQLREPVRFSDGIRALLQEPSRLLLEVGPGNSLCLLAKEHSKEKPGVEIGIYSSIRHIKQTDLDIAFILKTLGNLWLAGAPVDWKNYYCSETRRRIPLPTYPFERKRYWLEGINEKEPAPLSEIEMASTLEEKPIEDSVAAGAKDAGVGKSEVKVSKTFQPRPQLNNEYVAPTNDSERSITAIWEDILGIQPIGIEDNFFDLGGHSLLAALFLSRLQEELGVRLELKSIFESPTVATIAKVLETEKERDKDKNVQDLEALLDEIEGLPEN